jgi:hypothetical protein
MRGFGPIFVEIMQDYCAFSTCVASINTCIQSVELRLKVSIFCCPSTLTLEFRLLPHPRV